MEASPQNASEPLVSVAEYRRLLNDHKSTDDQILMRLRYLESLCRDIIQHELANYVA